MIEYDAELVRHHQILLRALYVLPHDRVLDVGCGAGQTTRAVARMASAGQVLGVDTAESALQQARSVTMDARLRNVEYVRADAGHLPLLKETVDLVISRFGTMFFREPVAAFTDIRECMRPDGRLMMMVWQAAQYNTWAVAIHRALVGDNSAMPESPPGPSAFSFGDPHHVRNTLHSAGVTDVILEAVHEPVYYGADVESALEFVLAFANVKGAMDAQSLNERERTLSRLRCVMVAQRTSDGIWFDSKAWIVKAGRGLT